MLSKHAVASPLRTGDHQSARATVRDRKIMRDLRPAVARPATGRLLRWTLAVTLGETVGFAVPAAGGAGKTAAGWGSLPILIAMVLAGAVEGAVLGTAQADCLY